MVLSGEGSDEIFGGYQYLNSGSALPAPPLGLVKTYDSILREEVKLRMNLPATEIKLYEDILKSCPPLYCVEDNQRIIEKEEIEYRKRIYVAIKFLLHFMLERKVSIIGI